MSAADIYAAAAAIWREIDIPGMRDGNYYTVTIYYELSDIAFDERALWNKRLIFSPRFAADAYPTILRQTIIDMPRIRRLSFVIIAAKCRARILRH